MVFPDQFRTQSLGLWSAPGFAGHLRGGGDPVHTPHLDAFARESLVLSRATSTAPVCSAYRGMLFSGLLPQHNGVPHNCGHDRPDCHLRPELTCLTDLLADAGYATGYIGKWHLDYPHCFDPDRPDWYPGGWDVYTPPERRHGIGFWHSYGTFDVHKRPHYWNEVGERIDPERWSPEHEADVACDFISRQAVGADPFALFVAMNPPHTPNDSVDDCMAEDLALYAHRPLDELLVRPNVSGSPAELAAARYYFAQVTGVDRCFGRILRALAAAGVAEDTLVLFTADHGECLCSHGVRGKNRIWSECFDVPFLLRAPGLLAPAVDDLLLSPIDIMPTLLGLLGHRAMVPTGIDGRDYSGLWTDGPAPARPEAVPFMRNVPGPQDASGLHRGFRVAARGVKTLHHSFVCEDLDAEPYELCFDDDADPYQQHPLSPTDAPDLFAELRARLPA
ncbi:MAG: sulfatase [Planctomycetota bacterium]